MLHYIYILKINISKKYNQLECNKIGANIMLKSKMKILTGTIVLIIVIGMSMGTSIYAIENQANIIDMNTMQTNEMIDHQSAAVPSVEEGSDCGCEYNTKNSDKDSSNCNYVVLDGGYVVLKDFPTLTEEDLKTAIQDPQPTRTTYDLPDYWSWMDYGGDWTTPAKNQGSCGSCFAFGALGAMDAAINIASGNPNTDIDLSVQYVLSCLSSAGSCNGGWMHSVFDSIYSTVPGSIGNGINGCIIESCLPYQAVDYIPCDDKCEDWDYIPEPLSMEGKLWEIESWGWTNSFNEDDPNDWDTMKTWILDYGPIVIDLYASSGWSSYWNSHHSSNDVYENDDYGTTNHANVLVGWKDDPSVTNGGYWILKNSWGTNFGYDGFNNVAYGCLGVGTRDTSWVITPEWEHQGPGPSDTRVYAGFSWNPDYPKPGDEIEFRDKSQGPVVLIEWDFNGDGVTDSTASRPTWSWIEEGGYEVSLTVWNTGGLSSTITYIVGVKEIWPPIADPRPRYYSGQDTEIQFEARYSYDVDGQITGYEWDLDGDGVTDSTELNPIYTFPNQNGEHIVTLTVTDDEGGKGSAISIVRIDKSQPPETTAEIGKIGGIDDEWFNSIVDIRLTATDWSGVDKLFYRLDGGDWNDVDCYDSSEYSINILRIGDHGIHNLEFYSVDIFGNQESTNTEQIKIDKVDPVANITIDGDNNEDVYLPPVTVTINCNDADSGVETVKYQLDLSWNDYTQPFTISKPGLHVIYLVVRDLAGNTYEVGTTVVIENAPSKPTILGPSKGKPGEQLTYTFESYDLFGDDISYYIDWGDGTTTGWTDYTLSGTPITETHVYNEQNRYTLKAKAKDTKGAESDWTTLEITMPKNKAYINPLFLQILEKFLENHPNMFPMLRHLMRL